MTEMEGGCADNVSATITQHIKYVCISHPCMLYIVLKCPFFLGSIFTHVSDTARNENIQLKAEIIQKYRVQFTQFSSHKILYFMADVLKQNKVSMTSALFPIFAAEKRKCPGPAL